MSQVVISVEELSKSYQLRNITQKSTTSFREAITEKLTNGFGQKKQQRSNNTFWALDDLSFSIKEGERVGIVGRNGAGKSTLLKILSRVTTPTKGKINIYGRVSSLLEVGTGFHPELTGRENILLNGSILGMSKTEILRNFDEIVAFSELEKFIDTPVKRYSSGMYVRLAFAVAAHLEPEILILDEVLAVGDSLFQKKCIDKMTKIGQQGKTILFVSHNLSAVEALCNKGILIQNGKLKSAGPIKDITNEYIDYNNLIGNSIDLLELNRDAAYAQELVFKNISFDQMPIPFGKPILITLHLLSKVQRTFDELDFGITINDIHSNTIIHCSNRFINKEFAHSSDEIKYLFEIGNNLKPGLYTLNLFLRSKHVIQDYLLGQVSIEIGEGSPYGFNDPKQIHGSTFPAFDIRQI